MKTNLRVVSLLTLLSAGVVMAQAAAKYTPPTQQQMEKAHAAMMEDRKAMRAQGKAIDADASAVMASVSGMQGAQVEALKAQVTKLQADVKALNAHLDQTPRFFDNPVSNNRP